MPPLPISTRPLAWRTAFDRAAVAAIESGAARIPTLRECWDMTPTEIDARYGSAVKVESNRGGGNPVKPGAGHSWRSTKRNTLADADQWGALADKLHGFIAATPGLRVVQMGALMECGRSRCEVLARTLIEQGRVESRGVKGYYVKERSL